MGKLQVQLAKARAAVREVSPVDAARLLDEGALLIDIREENETAGGHPERAKLIPRGFLELRIEDVAPDSNAPLLLSCQSGTRSLLAAAALVDLGYHNVVSMRGGFDAWVQSGLPIKVPARLSAAEKRRYGRHLRIPEVGEEGQLKLKGSRVLVVGCGGLGTPALLYLAAAGIGHLTLVDNDVVDESNLHRQVVYSESDIGKAKVEQAKAALLRRNSRLSIEALQLRTTSETIDALVAGHDVVIDGTDNFETRYLINDACVRLGIPLVHGSIYRFDGQVSVFWPALRPDAPCYRCVYPVEPPSELAPSCAEAGVLGVLPGVIGLLQATEALKILLQQGTPLVGKLISYDALTARSAELELIRDPACPCCSREPAR
jgi:molybdopterin/thiamine biosynthesis adenylyltransferase/rhodanese-related sulfurtransferase